MSEYPLGLIVVGHWLGVALLVVYVDAQTSHDPERDPVITPAASRRSKDIPACDAKRGYRGEKLKA